MSTLCSGELKIHTLNSIYATFIVRHQMRVTPPHPLRTAYRPILALRTAYCHFLASHTAYCLTTKTIILGVSIYIKKIKWQYVHAHVQSFLKTLVLMCMLARFPIFWPPQINVEVYKCWNDPKKRKRSECPQTESYLTLYVTCVVFLDENWTFLK